MFPVTKGEALLSQQSIHPDRKTVILPVLFITAFDIIFMVVLCPGLSGSVGGVFHAGGLQREPATNSSTKAVN